VSAPSGYGASSGSNAITTVWFSFRPRTLTVVKGTTVTWTNSDTPTRTVTSDPGDPAAFDSNNLAPAAHFTFAFAQAGTYKCHCKIHPSMTATVTVTG
jgi:plastocyanin